jgi:hypothetical protein
MWLWCDFVEMVKTCVGPCSYVILASRYLISYGHLLKFFGEGLISCTYIIIHYSLSNRKFAVNLMHNIKGEARRKRNHSCQIFSIMYVEMRINLVKNKETVWENLNFWKIKRMKWANNWMNESLGSNCQQAIFSLISH